ncbi:MAG: hypothetical protein K2X93_24960 [Candidatus Obscuribacterales bacterium]|nr:hypothetical protein [Candidatus Obscuribacterales bacterium]
MIQHAPTEIVIEDRVAQLKNVQADKQGPPTTLCLILSRCDEILANVFSNKQFQPHLRSKESHQRSARWQGKALEIDNYIYSYAHDEFIEPVGTGRPTGGKRYSESEDAKVPEKRTTKGYAPSLTLQIQRGPQYQKRNFSKRIVFTSESPSSCPYPAMSLKTSPVAIFT